MVNGQLFGNFYVDSPILVRYHNIQKNAVPVFLVPLSEFLTIKQEAGWQLRDMI
jgi:hypothetical protein